MDLKIPTQSEPTENSFPGAPRKVKKWLLELQATDISEITRQFYTCLKQSNRLVNDARARVEVMELLRPTARFVLDHLLKRYTTSGLPLVEKSQRIFNLNLAILTEMTFGYKIALQDSHTNKATALSAKLYALAAQRAVSYLAESLLRCMQIYKPIPNGIWRDLHQIYVSCEVTKCHNLPVADEELSNVSQCSVADAYKRTLLLALSRPESLRKGQIIHVYHVLETWVTEIKLGARNRQKDTGQLFGINLSTDTPPMQLKFLHASQDAYIRVLDLGDLMGLLAKKLDTMPKIDSPLVQDTELTRNALLRLQTNWGMQAQRQSARAIRNEEVTVEVGLTDIYERLSYLRTSSGPEPIAEAPVQEDYGLVSLSTSVRETEQSAHQGFSGFIAQSAKKQEQAKSNTLNWEEFQVSNTPSPPAYQDKKPVGTMLPAESVINQTWRVVNKSSGGFGLKWTGDGSTSVHVGGLLARQEAVEDKVSTQWCIGVIRWMQFDKDNTLLCGVQIISPRVVPVTVERKADANKMALSAQVCLMLPEIKPIGQVASLITKSYMFNAEETVAVQVGGRELKYKLTSIVEQTGSFSQFLIQSASVGGRGLVIPEAPAPSAKKPDKRQDSGEDEFDGVWDLL